MQSYQLPDAGTYHTLDDRHLNGVFASTADEGGNLSIYIVGIVDCGSYLLIPIVGDNIL